MIMQAGSKSPTPGRIAIVGYGSCNSLGTAETSYLTRTGRFQEALPEYARLTGITDRDVIDRRIGIRVPRLGDLEQPIDIQRFQGHRLERLKEDGTINGRTLRKGAEPLLEHTWKLPVVHAGALPSGWDLLKEAGFSGKPYDQFSRAHLILMRSLAEAMISMGVPWSEIERKVPEKQRAVAAAFGMGPGEDLYEGMAFPALKRSVRKDIVARFLPDNPAYWLQKILKARHASSRVAACNTGIANLEFAFLAMKAGMARFYAVASADSLLNEIAIVDFNAQKALATDLSVSNLMDHPSLVSRPGTTDRSGFVLAEGGGVLLLMEETLAFETGAIIYAYLDGVATATGQSKSQDPAAPTDGGILSMTNGLEMAAASCGMTEEEYVQFLTVINAHGTSTPAGDENGMAGYDRVLREKRRDPRSPVFVVYGKGGPRLDGIPSARRVGNGGTGHSLGGASLVAAVETIQMHRYGIIPPSVGSLDSVDPRILESAHLLYPTQPLSENVVKAQTSAQGFGDSNGDMFTSQNPDHGTQNPEAVARRDRWTEEVKSGQKKPAEFVPVIE